MRIIAGAYKGRTLQAPKGRTTRPTTDRIREALFNWLAHHPDIVFEGAHVADLFAGTGALGLEALSRGAVHATFVENHRAALPILQKNIHTLKAEAYVSVLKCDATRLPIQPSPFDIVFLDPPYNSQYGQMAIRAAFKQKWFKHKSFIVWESAANEDIDFIDLNLNLVEHRRYSDTSLHLLHA